MYSIQEIANQINGKVFGDNQMVIDGLCSINNGKKNHLSYFEDSTYFDYLSLTKASAIIVNNNFDISTFNKTFIKVSNAAKALSEITKLLYNNKKVKYSISKSSKIHPKAKLGKNIFIGHNVVIEDAVSISDNVCLCFSTPLMEYGMLEDEALIYHNFEDREITQEVFNSIFKYKQTLITDKLKVNIDGETSANSSNVLSASGALPIKLPTAAVTNSVVAICVVFVPDDAVVATGVPVKLGEASVA